MELVSPKCLMAVLWRFTLLPPGSTRTPEVRWPLTAVFISCFSDAQPGRVWFRFPCVSNAISISDEVVFVCFRSEPDLWSWGGNLHPEPKWSAWELYGTGKGKETAARLKQNHQESSTYWTTRSNRCTWPSWCSLSCSRSPWNLGLKWCRLQWFCLMLNFSQLLNQINSSCVNLWDACRTHINLQTVGICTNISVRTWFCCSSFRCLLV